MSSSVLRQWAAREFARKLHPERNDAESNAFERWLGAGIGRVLRFLSPLRVLALRRFARQVERQGARLQGLQDAQLREEAQRLRAAIAVQGLPRALSAQVFALVREVSGRTLGMRHYPTQLMAGYTMLRGGLAELQTGEGKTLSATLPAVAVALAGIPVHVVTVNEYLAQRDATIMAPVYGFFGLAVGFLAPEQSPEERRAAYACDVTYCINKDLVFDYLKDQLGAGRLASARVAVRKLFGAEAAAGAVALRGLYFAIVDEADSILVDEARTPLIISAPGEESLREDDLREAMRIARALQPHDMVVARAEHSVRLNPEGQRHAAALAQGLPGLWRFRKAREEMVEQALAALLLYERDRQYLVADAKVQIVDEFTGRTMADRSWERGLHQLIEMKEGVALSEQRETIASVTYQRFFRRYLRLSGMSGTVAEVAPELRAVFALDFVAVPSHRPLRRRNLGDRVFVRADDRWQAVVRSIVEKQAAGRSVLVGTRSVEASEHLSALLAARGIEHTLLNARQDAAEAEIVAAAGQPGRVTVATNMAGRGTDISLAPSVRDAGGLHVILTEFHESRRIDRQLQGRAGRQGDPGSCESLVSLQDELFTKFGGVLATTFARRYAGAGVLPAWAGKVLRWWAQRATERLNARVRRRTLEADRHTARSLAFSGRGE